MNDKTLVERLREHVFYGDARLFNFKKHSPLAMEAADTIEAQATRIEALEAALREIAGGAKTGEEMFKERLGDWLYPTWFVVNVLQDSLAACHATAERALESKP